MTLSRLACLLVVVALNTRVAFAQSPGAFTYQGELTAAGANYTGTANFAFELFDVPVGGNATNVSLVQLGVPVKNGRFTTIVDFGEAAFASGAPRWLEVAVSTDNGFGAFTTLSPRQPVSPAPIALGVLDVAITRGGAETVDQNQLDGISSALLGSVNGTTWQSFTMGKSGKLSRVDFVAATGLVGNNTLIVRVYAGVGLGGPLLATAEVPVGVSPSVVSLAFPSVVGVAGQAFTLQLAGGVLVAAADSTIPGTSNSPPYPRRFKTYSTPETTIGARAARAELAASAMTASSVPWIGITGVPANVNAAYSPWTSVSGGIAYSSGKVGIGTTAPGDRLSLQGGALSFANPADPVPYVGMDYDPATDSLRLRTNVGTAALNGTALAVSRTTGNVGIGYSVASQKLAVNGNVLANNVAVPSSIRFKDHVSTMDDALESLLKLEGVRFDWKSEWAKERPGREHDIGFVAEDVEKVFPEVVFRDEKGNVTGMDYSRLTAVAVQAIKQLNEQNARERAADRAELDRLKIDASRRDLENADLRSRLERLEAAMGSKMDGAATR